MDHGFRWMEISRLLILGLLFKKWHFTIVYCMKAYTFSHTQRSQMLPISACTYNTYCIQIWYSEWNWLLPCQFTEPFSEREAQWGWAEGWGMTPACSEDCSFWEWHCSLVSLTLRLCCPMMRTNYGPVYTSPLKSHTDFN